MAQKDDFYARFKSRTLHVPNLMQMSENNRFFLICIRFSTCKVNPTFETGLTYCLSLLRAQYFRAQSPTRASCSEVNSKLLRIFVV